MPRIGNQIVIFIWWREAYILFFDFTQWMPMSRIWSTSQSKLCLVVRILRDNRKQTAPHVKFFEFGDREVG